MAEFATSESARKEIHEYLSNWWSTGSIDAVSVEKRVWTTILDADEYEVNTWRIG